MEGSAGAGEGYRILSEATLPAYLAQVESVAQRLGGPAEAWSVREVGDGNLNLVFIVKGASGGVAVKQALPFVRLVGERWPLPLSRSHYEHQALVEQAKVAPALVPAILHYDPALALVAMELLEPHIIMRRGMVAGTRYPRFADDISTFMARTLFFTSDLALAAAQKKQRIAAFAGNHALCKITEDLIFTEPYMTAEQNRWTRPWLDPIAATFGDNLDLHVAVSRLKLKFLSAAEAMIHGDLHTGSVMVTQADTRVIDPEFAFYGPMGFDVGAVIGNLLMNYFAQAGHEAAAGERADYEEWVLAQAEAVWTGFRSKFLALWRTQARGDAYPSDLFLGDAGALRLDIERQAYLDRLFQDTVGFAAAKTIRRILGLAHNIDFEWIEPPARRATCEARALMLARQLMIHGDSFTSIASVTDAARAIRRWDPKFA
jgi:5-methylthioribose kinase